MRKALIFGMGGFVGPYLAKELTDHNCTVYGSDVVEGKNLQYCEKFFPCNLLDEDAVEDVIRQVEPDWIVNLAAISSVGLSWKIPKKTMEVNVCGGLNILEAVRKLGLKSKILFIGSSEEYAISSEPMNEENPTIANNPYGISKATMETFSQIYNDKYGMEVCHVRSFNHTGVGQKDTFVLASWCKQVAEITKTGKAGVMHVGNLTVKRDFSDVRDMVRAYRMVLEKGDCKEVYNIGSGRAYALSELLDKITSFAPVDIKVEVDENLLRVADNSVICCDHSKITKELGWKPEYTIYDTLQGMYEEFLK